jgi:homoserine O-acetyltransferase
MPHIRPLLAAFVAALAIAACQSTAPVAQAPAAPPKPAPAPAPAEPPTSPDGSLAGVNARRLVLHDFKLKSGVVLKDLEVAYETYGKLDASGRNAVLIAHGNTSTQHAAGRYQPQKSPPNVPPAGLGWWDALIGPNKAFDTRRYFVVSSNMLGGAYGTTGPRSFNPATNRPYGADFPKIELEDMVAVQRALLESLGVKHLVAVAGPSYGGFLAFQWAITYPDMVDGIVAVATSPRGGHDPKAVDNLVARLARDNNWKGGNYYDRRGAMVETLAQIRMDTLRRYGMERQLEAQYPDKTARYDVLYRMSHAWAETFDANSLVVQRRAAEFRDQAPSFGRIKAKVLYVLCTTDEIFPTSLAPRVMADLKAAGVDATYYELDSPKGHNAGTQDAAKWEPALREFLAKLPPPG